MSWGKGNPRTSTRAHRTQRTRILERDNHQCRIQGPRCTHLADCMDHRDNTRGPNYYRDSNCQAACTPCNQWKAGQEGAAARHTNRRTPEQHPGLKHP